MGQLLLGLLNGAFYAMLSLGLAVIFGLLRVVNFAHGAQYMVGAFIAWMLLEFFGLSYWWALLLAPVITGVISIAIERTLIAPLAEADHLYGLLMTFGIAMVLQGGFQIAFGSAGIPYRVPPELAGGLRLSFMYLPNYRLWVLAASIAVCLIIWLMIEKTSLGAYLRAATEDPDLVGAFGVNVALLITVTYGLGAALAAFAGVLAAPIYAVNPLMGVELLIIAFAVVVVGGMGSILGAVVTGFMLGVIEALTKIFYPEAASMVIFIIMILVLMVRPYGLFGRQM
ncbi:branched-chain amino acid ABC transporter permease [Aquamicrobium sp. LC103]|uniref:branched-chain amino acid ABC transporter permease n=1 Tax=Aquamicrobium sp. LC103 TaxID=1120658 RepID=UPI000A9E9452|nr:branched-chain amino acid ABC transporter permease [Aquamicrobium sp. LC103]